MRGEKEKEVREAKRAERGRGGGGRGGIVSGGTARKAGGILRG